MERVERAHLHRLARQLGGPALQRRPTFPSALDLFLAEARVINKQLTPIWCRKANREHVRRCCHVG